MTEETLFELAVATPAADRPALLDRECAGNPELRARVEALLAADEWLESRRPSPQPAEAGGAAEAPPPGMTRDYRPAEGIGAVLAGKYKLVEEIGEGGMGTVWMAQQTAPVRRAVAVKVIKAGMDSRSVLARFEAERQALAMMDHPNIARVLDAGTTDGGRPFFVMELVKGVPITRFCDERRLSPRQRLELFVPVCQAIQHAHQKGVIHRDIKPSNVLIALYDDHPVPKVIDFGVAKATGPALTEQTMLTGFGGIVGTPEYMSPEQASLNNLDVDTRSDVYALGVLLYELLTGTTPVDRRRLGQAAILEVLRVVREVEPPAPSSRLSTVEGLPGIASNRSVEPARLAGLLRGELDWIVMKALEKDRVRRYETANALARDIQRHLADELVEARPPSAGYRLRKLARRHRGQVIAASLVLLALVVGMIGTSLGYVRADRARESEARRAEGERLARLDAQRQKAAAEAAERAMRAEAEKVKTINAFLTEDLLSQAEPDKNAAEDRVTLVEVLDRAAEKVGGRFADQPELEWELRWTIAGTYHGLASWEKAEAQYRALLVSAREQDAGGARTFDALSELAHILRHRGQVGGEALAMAETAARGLKRRLGPDDPATLASTANLALAYLEIGKPDLAVPLLEDIYRRREARFGPDHWRTLHAMNNLATGYLEMGKPDQAAPLLETTLRLYTAGFGPDHPHTIGAMNNLAGAYKSLGKPKLVLPLYEESLRRARVRFGPDHLKTLVSMSNLASYYQAVGELDRALPLLEEVVRRGKATLGPDHRLVLTFMDSLALAQVDAGKPDLALPRLEAAFRRHKADHGPDHPDTLHCMNCLAIGYWKARRLDQSVPLFEEVLERQKRSLGRSHPHTITTRANLGVNYKDAGRLSEALPLLEEAYRAGRTNPGLRFVTASLVDLYIKVGRAKEAVPLIGEQVAEARKAFAEGSPQLAGSLAQYGLYLLRANAFDEAEPLLRECLAIREEALPDDWRTFNTRSLLGGALLGRKKYAEAEPLLLQGYEGTKAREASIPPVGAVWIPEALDRLVSLYVATARPDEAERWRAERAKYPKGGEYKPAKPKTEGK